MCWRTNEGVWELKGDMGRGSMRKSEMGVGRSCYSQLLVQMPGRLGVNNGG